MSDFIEQISDDEIQLIGEITKSTVPAVLEATVGKVQQTADLTIDLSRVTRTDSAGLALLFEWMSFAHAHKNQLRFTNLPEQLLAIARASEMDGLIPLK